MFIVRDLEARWEPSHKTEDQLSSPQDELDGHILGSTFENFFLGEFYF